MTKRIVLALMGLTLTRANLGMRMLRQEPRCS